MKKNSFPVYKQLDVMDCGPTCLRIIAKHFGKSYSLQTLREKSYITREGVSLLGISDAAESIGMRTTGVKINYNKFVEEVPLPAIAHWNQDHFIVVYKITPEKVFVSDPAHGLLTYSKNEFLTGWQISNNGNNESGIVLLLEPTPDFYKQHDEVVNKSGFKFLFSYLRKYKKFVVQLIFGMLAGSIIQLIFPFLTQAIVDVGINHNNISFIYLILIAQLVFFVSRSSIEFIRSWILLHISTRINISIISDFLIKLMKLPLGFFDTKMIGDIFQRINDHNRIESFLTNSTLNILFSAFQLIIFSMVLLIYSFKIFLLFIVSSVIYITWVYLFMKKRRDLDYKRFTQLARNQGNIFQLINGMQEIKINNCEKQKRWQWEHIQARLFRVNVKSLSLSQYQQAGATLINEIKNIFITFFAATGVIHGDMTLGMMVAVQYILGQLSAPVEQAIQFVNSTQDAKISLERMGEIHSKDDEESDQIHKHIEIPERSHVLISDLSFQYEGPHSEFALKNINLEIPFNKITAVVGTSGSGKTTLMKLLLGFYPLRQGKIEIGHIQLGDINKKVWREKCGVVMQDGFIFSDTIINNVALSEELVDFKKVVSALEIANIREFVESLPLNYNTIIGPEGHGLSKGQIQRILIARAVYKNPEYLLFDEATNALDSNNELVIIKNLQQFFHDRTVFIIAHRLSTVKNADQIVVMEKGQILEKGTHNELSRSKGAYFHLVKNQLELDQ